MLRPAAGFLSLLLSLSSFAFRSTSEAVEPPISVLSRIDFDPPMIDFDPPMASGGLRTASGGLLRIDFDPSTASSGTGEPHASQEVALFIDRTLFTRLHR